MLDTPVLLTVFNRPDLTARVFGEIKKARPARLFVAADGPREGQPDDIELCRETRTIATAVDWPCEVRTFFRDNNLGCLQAMYQAVNWFFGHVVEGIVLEDDTMPHTTFFSFCSELLDRYRNTKKVLLISGSAEVDGDVTTDSYYFSPVPNLWGWASWRRAWELYDIDMKKYAEFIQAGSLGQVVKNRYHRRFWKQIFDKLSKGEVDSYAYGWCFTLFNYGGLAVIPSKNLVGNIGYGDGATHTSGTCPAVNRVASGMDEVLKHPAHFLVDEAVLHRVFCQRFHMLDTLGGICRQYIHKKISRIFTGRSG